MYNVRDLINDQYEVRQRLSGGMGYVYIAFDQVSQKTLAIKTLKDELAESIEATQRFEREARTWINLGVHKHIVHAISFHRGRDPLLILEYVDGVSLQRIVSSEPAGLSYVQTLSFAIQMADGLSFAHNCPMPGGTIGVIHRDLKPGNVMITKDCVAKLTDFGLARATNDSDLTSSRNAMGTLPYMPPEQWADAHSVNERADIYSLGVALYEMVAGTRPFPPGTPMELMFQIMNLPPEPLSKYRPDVDPEFAELILGCLEKRADDRPASASAVMQTLQGIEDRLIRQLPPRLSCPICGYAANRELLQCVVCGNRVEPTLSKTREAFWQCGCGESVSVEHHFCIYCGRERLTSGCCRNCGKSNPRNFQFCCGCGTSLTAM